VQRHFDSGGTARSLPNPDDCPLARASAQPKRRRDTAKWRKNSIFGLGPRVRLDRNGRARFKFLLRAHRSANRLTADQVALPVILMSGYNDLVARGSPAFKVLHKPIPYGELFRSVCACLDWHGATQQQAASAVTVPPRG
jgi:hypothetical protein